MKTTCILELSALGIFREHHARLAAREEIYGGSDRTRREYGARKRVLCEGRGNVPLHDFELSLDVLCYLPCRII